MKKFIFTFSFTFLILLFFTIGIKQGKKKAIVKNINQTVKILHQNKSKEKIWAYGIETKFEVKNIPNGDIKKIADYIIKQMEKEGLVTDYANNIDYYYIYGISHDHKYGKAVILIKEKNKSVTIIPSFHKLKSNNKIPEIPHLYKNIFGEIDLSRSIISMSNERFMISFIYENYDNYDNIENKIDKVMKLYGYKRDKILSIPRGKIMFYYTNKKECFFQIEKISYTKLKIFSANYPK